MAQELDPPIYWDQHSTRWNLTLIFSLVVVVLGFFSGFLLTALGLVMAAWSWFTTPRQYLLYRDRMTIVYGMPRTRVIPLGEMAHSELLSLPFGERLRIRMNDGKRMMLQMRDPSTFRGHLEDALMRYHGEQGGDFYVEGAGTVLSPADTGLLENDPNFGGRDNFGDELRDPSYVDTSEDPPVYSGRVEEAASTSGSYVEFDEGRYETPEPAPAAAPEDQPTTVSGNYTESAEPDYSGEGRPAYSADVELETGISEKPEDQRPPSPY